MFNKDAVRRAVRGAACSMLAASALFGAPVTALADDYATMQQIPVSAGSATEQIPNATSDHMTQVDDDASIPDGWTAADGARTAGVGDYSTMLISADGDESDWVVSDDTSDDYADESAYTDVSDGVALYGVSDDTTAGQGILPGGCVTYPEETQSSWIPSTIPAVAAALCVVVAACGVMLYAFVLRDPGKSRKR